MNYDNSGDMKNLNMHIYIETLNELFKGGFFFSMVFFGPDTEYFIIWIEGLLDKNKYLMYWSYSVIACSLVH